MSSWRACPELELWATVAVFGAGRELISQGLERIP
jgi:hypothetical protein